MLENLYFLEALKIHVKSVANVNDKDMKEIIPRRVIQCSFADDVFAGELLTGCKCPELCTAFVKYSCEYFVDLTLDSNLNNLEELRVTVKNGAILYALVRMNNEGLIDSTNKSHGIIIQNVALLWKINKNPNCSAILNKLKSLALFDNTPVDELSSLNETLIKLEELL